MTITWGQRRSFSDWYDACRAWEIYKVEANWF